MPRRLGSKGGAFSPESRERLRAAGRARMQAPQWRVKGSLATLDKVKAVLRDRLPDYLDRLHKLAADDDPRIALEASRYLTDRVLGRPTERLAGADDGTPIVVQQLPADAMQALAHRLLKPARDVEDGVSDGGEAH